MKLFLPPMEALLFPEILNLVKEALPLAEGFKNEIIKNIQTAGKQKLEKRMRKQGNDGVSGVGVDTPLNTVAVMINQQKDKQLPYVVLSGGGKNITVDK